MNDRWTRAGGSDLLDSMLYDREHEDLAFSASGDDGQGDTRWPVTRTPAAEQGWGA
ncbi:MAG TPA: hypothetical protein VMU09_01190 [Acidimicrobiales bacterium]|nr:hypothetical protein [Acidimicrobiales bacterium]